MKTLLYYLLNLIAQKLFKRGYESHYTGIDCYPKKYDSAKDRLYLQRYSRTKELSYFRWEPPFFTFGITWIHGIKPGLTINLCWINFRKTQLFNYTAHQFPHKWTIYPINLIQEYLREKRKQKLITQMLNSGEYTMDPMGVIHHIDDDQAAYYE